MTKYIMWGSYCEDVLEKRAPYRQAHLDGLAKQKESGVLITIGPTKDVTKVFGIYEAQDEAAVDRKSTRLNSSHSGESRMPSSA